MQEKAWTRSELLALFEERLDEFLDRFNQLVSDNPELKEAWAQLDRTVEDAFTAAIRRGSTEVHVDASEAVNKFKGVLGGSSLRAFIDMLGEDDP